MGRHCREISGLLLPFIKKPENRSKPKKKKTTLEPSCRGSERKPNLSQANHRPRDSIHPPDWSEWFPPALAIGRRGSHPPSPLVGNKPIRHRHWWRVGSVRRRHWSGWIASAIAIGRETYLSVGPLRRYDSSKAPGGEVGENSGKLLPLKPPRRAGPPNSNQSTRTTTKQYIPRFGFRGAKSAKKGIRRYPINPNPQSQYHPLSPGPKNPFPSTNKTSGSSTQQQ